MAPSDCQRLCILRPNGSGGSVIQRLTPQLTVAGKRMVMDTAQITHVPLQMLGKQVADLSHERRAIIDAIDMLTHGI